MIKKLQQKEGSDVLQCIDVIELKINELVDIVKGLVKLASTESGAREQMIEGIYKELRSDPIIRKIWELDD